MFSKNGLLEIAHCCSACLYTCSLFEHRQYLPVHPGAHPQRGKCTDGHTIPFVQKHQRKGKQNRQQITNPFQSKIPSPQQGIVDSLPFQHKNGYAHNFHTVDEGY
jgi:hypothetical protein